MDFQKTLNPAKSVFLIELYFCYSVINPHILTKPYLTAILFEWDSTRNAENEELLPLD